jgi:Glu-tRNA(Gln) amidotransferase subunit E-like FAD-binding protein
MKILYIRCAQELFLEKKYTSSHHLQNSLSESITSNQSSEDIENPVNTTLSPEYIENFINNMNKKIKKHSTIDLGDGGNELKLLLESGYIRVLLSNIAKSSDDEETKRQSIDRLKQLITLQITDKQLNDEIENFAEIGILQNFTIENAPKAAKESIYYGRLYEIKRIFKLFAPTTKRKCCYQIACVIGGCICFAILAIIANH